VCIYIHCILIYYIVFSAKPIDVGISVGDNPNSNTETTDACSLLSITPSCDESSSVVKIETSLKQSETTPPVQVTKDTTAIVSTVEDSRSRDSGTDSLSGVDVIEKHAAIVEGSSTANSPLECKFKKETKVEIESGVGTVWNEGWRTKLCRCSQCKV
jgi:hypothetical protein